MKEKSKKSLKQKKEGRAISKIYSNKTGPIKATTFSGLSKSKHGRKNLKYHVDGKSHKRGSSGSQKRAEHFKMEGSPQPGGRKAASYSFT